MNKLVVVTLLIPLSVAGFSFLQAVAGYLNGTAHMWAVGRPGPEFRNLDRRYRVHWQTSGCMVLGPELLTHPGNNAAIALMTTLFGPMRGTYHGPYPDREQAGEALRSSQQIVSIEALQSPWQEPRDCGALNALFPPQEGLPVARCALFRESTFVLGYDGYATLRTRDSGTTYARYRVE